MHKPAVPSGLGKQGRAFFREVHNSYELDVRDGPILLETCRVLDEIEALKAAIDADGVISIGSKGQPVEHPALAGLRAHRLSLDRLMTRLGLPDAEGEAPLTVAQMKARKAAAARWVGHRKDVARRTDRGAG